MFYTNTHTYIYNMVYRYMICGCYFTKTRVKDKRCEKRTVFSITNTYIDTYIFVRKIVECDLYSYTRRCFYLYGV